MTYIGAKDFFLEVSSGNIDGTTHVNKFGSELIAGSGKANTDIVGNGGGVYVPPTENRIHQFKSTSIQDVGSLIGTYTSTTFNQTSLIDSGATFISDGVTVGDWIVNDTSQDHTIVTVVVSETELTVESWHHSDESNVGNSFRIATKGGTGAVFFHIKLGQLKDGTLLTEFLLCNGTTNVPTVNSYYRISRGHIHGAGTNKNNVGTLTLIADGDLTTTVTVAIDKGQTLMAFVHVPIGKTAYMTNVYANMFRSNKVADAMGDMQLMSNLWGGDGELVEHSFGISTIGGQGGKDFSPYKKFTQGTDIWLRCIETTDASSKISAGFDLIIVDND